MKKQKNKWTGDRIKKLREEIGIKQEEFAGLIQCRSRHYVSTLEKKGVRDGSNKAMLLDTVETVQYVIKKDYHLTQQIKSLQSYLQMR